MNEITEYWIEFIGVLLVGVVIIWVVFFSPFSESGKIYEFCVDKGFDGGHWHQAHGIECTKTTWHEECYSKDYCRTKRSQQVEHFSSIEKEELK